MSKVRPLNERKYEISKHKFYEVYHYCLQYPEWKRELRKIHTLQSPNIDGMPHGSSTSDPTELSAMRIADLSYKCDLIETTVLEAGPEIYKWLLIGVTDDHYDYNALHERKIPCGRNQYYDARRLFYCLMAGKI